ncbi:DUF5335 family protein [Janthinobacterium agaricidamnosum]|uniref:Uncharacterized protein n=1 Tax=Janthinobacterium agaricidamnosum NBRC 102515 = DSM 9628 TaxID=1349767 RepID=W0UZS5_9BURK|nr:DUF5335 family protein [Janthinobacterium agaricidamnosum]CDG82074.1 putative uncharacterized protein [Janthinobacterium agaricidamnosum NBRC 102515 = DSM 9628]
MAIFKLEKNDWHAYFERIAKVLMGKSAELEVDALSIGSQLQARWAPLMGIVYDPRSDILAVMLEGLDHMIRHPQTIFVDMQGDVLNSLDVNDADNFRHIIKLRDPLPLPP